VSTRLLVKTLTNTVAVPNGAIQHGPNGLYAYVVNAANKVDMRPLKVGDEGADRTVVTAGLSAGERVVTAGQYRLTQGALVAARTANGGADDDDKQANASEAR
jgi:multidrug efflux system membrane fusion protein